MDIGIYEALQSVELLSNSFMSFFSAVGHGELYLLVVIIAMWCIDYKQSLLFGLLITLMTFSSEGVKILIAQSRPIINHVPIQDFGMPSSHSSTAVIFWGYLMHLTRKRILQVIFLVMIMMIALSRIYLEAHYFSQVMAGLLFGGVVLYIFIKKELSIKLLIPMITLLLVISSFLSLKHGYGQKNLTHVYQVFGLICGLIIGHGYNKQFNFKVKMKASQNVIKIIIILTVMIIYAILHKIVGDIDFTIWGNLIYLYTVHFVLAIGLTAGLGRVFIKLNLVESKVNI